MGVGTIKRKALFYGALVLNFLIILVFLYLWNVGYNFYRLDLLAFLWNTDLNPNIE